MATGAAGRPIRVAVVDDHPLVLEGTRAALERAGDIVVVGEAADGAGALRLAAEARPDVLVLDLRLPDMSGVEVARRVRERQPTVAIVALTAAPEAGLVQAVMRLGAAGFVSKSAACEALAAAVRAAAAGRRMVVTDGDGVDSDEGRLSAREGQALRLAACGLGNTAIAARLSISVKTVEYHLGQAYTKLGATSRSDAIRIALQRGLLLVEDLGPIAE
jgi:DNA-binding NarL/FixJ family response regulator